MRERAAAAPAPAGVLPRPSMFASLHTRNYRLWTAGQVVSLVGTWMQRVAQDWLVLTLTGGDAVALGVVAALQFGPTLVLSMWGGMLADRYDKRRLILATQTLMAGCALALGLLDIGGVVALWQVYLIALAMGCVSAVDAPVRQSFVVEMVGPEQLTNAVGLNSMTFNLARIVGPAVAGVLIAVVGTGWVFLINVGTFTAVITALLAMNAVELLRPLPTPRARGQLRAGLRYVRGRPDLRMLLLTVFLVATFGLNFPITLAILARNVFGRGSDSYGLLLTMLAVGTLTGATVAARRTGRPRIRLLLGGAAAFGVFETAAGLMPTYLLVGVVLVPAGVAALTFTTSAMSTVQLAVPADMRGRVMGIYLLCFLGGTPFGGPLLGWVANTYGGRAPIVIGGLISLATALGCALYLVRHEGLRLRLDRSTGASLPVLVIRPAAVADAVEQAVRAR